MLRRYLLYVLLSILRFNFINRLSYKFSPKRLNILHSQVPVAGAMTLSIMTFTIMTLSIRGLYVTVSINET